MSGTDRDEFDRLVSAWMNGSIGEQDANSLQQRLRESEEYRHQFIGYTRLDASLREMTEYQTQPPFESSASQPPNRTDAIARPGYPWRNWGLAIGGIAALVLCILFLGLSSQPTSVASVTGISGPLRWTGDAGRVTTNLTVGQALPGGTIDGLSPESWFELSFRDGSSVTISGNSMLTFADDGQKVLHLKSGKLTANVQKQPLGRPMLIHTRSATLTVLGTIFDVEAALPKTTVDVREGMVRVQRVSDGKSLDVPAQHRLIAGADQAFENQRVPDHIDHWRSSLAAGPHQTFGEWLPGTDQQPPMLKSVAFVPKENPDVLLYLLGMEVHSEDQSPVIMSPECTFQLSGNLDVSTDVYFGVWAAHEDGEFAGKYLAKATLQGDETGHFNGQIEMKDFGLDPSVLAWKDKLPSSPRGLILKGVWCFTHSASPSGLRVSAISMQSNLPSSPFADEDLR